MVRFIVAFAFALLGHIYVFQYSFDLGSEIPPQLISDSSVSVTLNESPKSQENTRPDTEPSLASQVDPEVQPVLPPPTPVVKKEFVKPIKIKKTRKKNNKIAEPPATEEVCESPLVENDNIVEKVVKQPQQKREASAEKSTPNQAALETESTKNRNVHQTSSSVIEARPLYQYNPKPEYPALARQRGWEGIVSLLVEVKANGDVASVLLHGSCGYKILDKSAIRAVKSWRFIPGTKDGQQLQSTIVIPVHFKLN